MSYLLRQIESLEELVIHTYPKRKCDPEIRRAVRDFCRAVRAEHGFPAQPPARAPSPEEKLPPPAHFAQARLAREESLEARRRPATPPAALPAPDAVAALREQMAAMAAQLAAIADAPRAPSVVPGRLTPVTGTRPAGRVVRREAKP